MSYHDSSARAPGSAPTTVGRARYAERAVRYALAPLILIALTTTACGRNVKGCLEEAEKLGITGAQANELCTTPCDDLSATYGIAQDKCEELQSGGQRSGFRRWALRKRR